MSSTQRPSLTRFEPRWSPLGTTRKHREERYWIAIGDQPHEFRGVDLCGLAFLASIYPDLAYWRHLFPLGQGHGVDTKGAMMYFIRACQKAGEYTPPDPTTKAEN